MCDASLASHTLCREEGLVTLQSSSCRHGRNLLRPMRSTLFEDCICCHQITVTLCYVFSRCHLVMESVCSIIEFHGDNSSAAVGPDPSSLRRVWLARLVRCMLFADCICWHGVASMLSVCLADLSILLVAPHQLHVHDQTLSLFEKSVHAACKIS